MRFKQPFHFVNWKYGVRLDEEYSRSDRTKERIIVSRVSPEYPTHECVKDNMLLIKGDFYVNITTS